jgi:divalent metal cation (Fe/Co/Zn/Cd) transporter
MEKLNFFLLLLEGVMIAFAGIWIIFEAINHIINPQQIKELDLGILLIIIAALVNFIVGFIAVKKGKKNNSIALIASGKHLISDTFHHCWYYYRFSNHVIHQVDVDR